MILTSNPIGVMPSDIKVDGAQTRKADPSSTTAPRKRRKRTVGSGAADDCFTCASRGTKCDRRRPYCSQCLDLGRDCSGYKTTLTWGVGVASRGKLRGLSLPVSGGQPVAVPQKRRNQGALEEKGKAKGRQSTRPFPTSGTEQGDAPVAVPSTFHWMGTASAPQQLPDTAPPFADLPNGAGWTAGASTVPVSALPSYDVNGSASAFRGIFTSGSQVAGPGIDGGSPVPVSGAAFSAGGYEAGFPTVSEGIIPHQWPQEVSSTFQFNGNRHDSLGTVPPSAFSEWSSNSLPNGSTGTEEGNAEDMYTGHGLYSEQSVAQYSHRYLLDTPLTTSLPQLLLDQSVGRTPRIRYLISYYAEVIAPVIVAFDSPTNPYRVHILRLAQDSVALQHAVAALSASNMRQRRERKISSTERTVPARRSSLAHRALTDGSFQGQYGVMGPEELTREELFHKGMAIKSLNAQLSDPASRLTDSVLATLLVLCLFHICETGVAKFQTQFAGVKKLLALRNRGLVTESEEGKWYTRMFTWFDTMTATINNRESQLQGTYLDTAAFSDEEWALENLAGCDGRLFKIIGSLGRLNILSQNKPVEPRSPMGVSLATATIPPAMTHYTPHPQISHDTFVPSLSPGDRSLFRNPPDPENEDPGTNTQFRAEWHSVRQALESWRLDVQTTGTISPISPTSSFASALPVHSYISPPSSPSSQCVVSPDNLADLSNISESFRYSALLYTERLAFPDLPSDHPRIQNLVLTALHYISAVQSDVYLLWPLFITGSECVFEAHRALIRQRCEDIQKDSGFYNNISCLELLEKIWARTPNENGELKRHESSTGAFNAPTADVFDNSIFVDYVSGLLGQPQGEMSSTASKRECKVSDERGFRWRSVMESEGLEGEYIVV